MIIQLNITRGAKRFSVLPKSPFKFIQKNPYKYVLSVGFLVRLWEMGRTQNFSALSRIVQTSKQKQDCGVWLT